jgi:hypothetical protein
MQPWFIASALLALETCCLGQRVEIKPLDFQPLTSLPWEEKRHRTVEEVLKRIFLETKSEIRYPVLVEYFKSIPIEKLSQAFELCLALEGTQWPEDLASLLIPEWAQRNPQSAWDRNQALLRLKTTHWLGLDRWRRPKIEVADRMALQISPYWLERGLETFPVGSVPPVAYQWKWAARPDQVTKSFAEEIPDFKAWAEMCAERGETGRFEIALRRWLMRTPPDAPEIIKVALNVSWGQQANGEVPKNPGLSDELLLLWSRMDLEGMARYAETVSLDEGAMALRIKGLLLSLVSEEKRQLWLALARGGNNDEHRDIHDLLPEWAQWDPKPALAEALVTGEPETIENASIRAAYGLGVYNSCHYGLGMINEFDFGSLPRKLRDEVTSEWGITIMERWGDIDIGEAARYGLKFMLATDYAPRGDLIKLFSGDDEYSSDSDMIDRTFCALRTWAVVRPTEMKAWIAKQEGEDMRKALTWLLENPWGTGTEE